MLLSETSPTDLHRDNDPLVRAYNDVAYTSVPGTAAHPDRLATIATRFGLGGGPIATCRGPEMACGNGMNLVSIAATRPKASVTGFDFTARPTTQATGQARAPRLAH